MPNSSSFCGDEELVVDRERDGLALGAVAQRGVEGVDLHRGPDRAIVDQARFRFYWYRPRSRTRLLRYLPCRTCPQWSFERQAQPQRRAPALTRRHGGRATVLLSRHGAATAAPRPASQPPGRSAHHAASKNSRRPGPTAATSSWRHLDRPDVADATLDVTRRESRFPLLPDDAERGQHGPVTPAMNTDSSTLTDAFQSLAKNLRATPASRHSAASPCRSCSSNGPERPRARTSGRSRPSSKRVRP